MKQTCIIICVDSGPRGVQVRTWLDFSRQNGIKWKLRVLLRHHNVIAVRNVLQITWAHFKYF